MNLLKCPRCGEEYSPSYRRCPFCEEGDHPRKIKYNSSKQSGGRRVSDKKQTQSVRGAMAAVLHFNVDAIVYTAGMAYEDFFCNDISAYVSKIAPIIRLPGEEEMRSLAEGALRVLRGEQEAAQY
mgnify:CR=1 FL=1